MNYRKFHRATKLLAHLPHVPTLQYCLSDGERLWATDLENGVLWTLPPQLRNNIGAGCIPLDKLETLGEHDRVEFPEPQTIRVVRAHGEVSTDGTVPPEGYPEPPVLEGTPPAYALAVPDIWNRVKASLPEKHDRSYLHAVLLEGNAAVTTDTHRLTVCEHKGVVFNTPLLVPSRAFAIAAELGLDRIATDGVLAELRSAASDIAVYTELGDAQTFPPYRRLIAASRPANWLLEPRELLAGLEQVMRVAKQVGYVSIRSDAGCLILRATAGEKTAEVALEKQKLSREVAGFTINARYLQDAVRALMLERSEIRAQVNGHGPLFFEAGALRVLVMPMRWRP